MCGISGIWKLNNTQVNENELRTFTDSLSHRGPDGAGYWINNSKELGLGHRRLSILDTSENGSQPMHAFNGDHVIVYNGEIFNFLELKRELSSEYEFSTGTDTEVILAAYIKWGEECVHKFNGMWAFAIYNKRTHTLFLSRDRWGIKPLYYFSNKERFCFASETIAFRHLENFKREIDPDLLKRAISNFESMEGYGYTIFANIFNLLPGHSITLKRGEKVNQKKWWDTRKNLVKVPASYEEQKEEFFRLFKNACELRLRSDVPVATALSGGLDSSAVYCMIKHIEKNSIDLERLPSDWQRAFIATFPGELADEKKYAEIVLKYTGSKGNFIEIDQNKICDDIYNSTYLFDSIADSPINAVSNIYRGMRNNGIRVSLDGHGVDEMMYGYKMLVKKLAIQAAFDKDRTRLNDIKNTYSELFFPEEKEQQLSYLEKEITSTSFKKENSLFTALKSNIKKRIGLKIDPVTVRQFVRPFSGKTFPALTNYSDNYHQLNDSERLTYQTFHLTTLPSVLRNFDRASMQSSIEVRMPFMDYRLVSYIFSLPTTSLVGNGFTKKILRDSLKDIMPSEISNRKLKLGFPVPLETWVKKDCKNMFMDLINSQTFLQSEIWDGKAIQAWAEENYKNNKWTDKNVNLLWVYVNAHIINKN